MSRASAADDGLEDSVLRSIRRITRSIDIYSRQLRAACDLTGPQLICMRQLAVEGSMTLSDLAAVISLSLATVSGIVDRLEARGLVRRERQQADKRRVLVILTRAGEKALRRAPPPLQEQFTRRFRALPARRQAALNKALREIVTMMEAEDIDASPILVPAAELQDAAGR